MRLEEPHPRNHCLDRIFRAVGALEDEELGGGL